MEELAISLDSVLNTHAYTYCVCGGGDVYFNERKNKSSLKRHSVFLMQI